LGVAAGLPWLPAAIVGFSGNLFSLVPVVYAGEKIKNWIVRWTKKSEHEKLTSKPVKKDRKSRIFEKLGVPGLAFLGPILIGVHAAAAFAVAAGASKRGILFWFTCSLLLCSLLFGLLANFGLTPSTEEHQLPLSWKQF